MRLRAMPSSPPPALTTLLHSLWYKAFKSSGHLLGLSGDDLRDAIRLLVELGFLEASGDSYKMPFLYRSGLGVSQGKGFDEDPQTSPTNR
jgi:hypothetical protein